MGNTKRHKRVDVDDITTWTIYSPHLCSTCRANCCTLPVEVELRDLIRMGVITRFEAAEPVEKIAEKLKKDGVVEHVFVKERAFTLAKRANKDCLYLDPTSRKCTIYKNRPDICKEHPDIGSRPGFCAYEPK